jgi:hypothetical protein
VPTSSPAGSLGHRRLGELRATVLAYLTTEHLGQSFTAGEIAGAHGDRSTGAIGTP